MFGKNKKSTYNPSEGYLKNRKVVRNFTKTSKYSTDSFSYILTLLVNENKTKKEVLDIMNSLTRIELSNVVFEDNYDFSRYSQLIIKVVDLVFEYNEIRIVIDRYETKEEYISRREREEKEYVQYLELKKKYEKEEGLSR